ncbi:DUF4013 domain-containing protein [Methanoplanus sp. FWC-SCC4]|uniref:DUF4013 domain-containing protein n=1 Tax=Methanochimaera problematica TaxID=2609417 RepID=A0AA97I3W3_9EURY|nr:DUF4013 domain-containing protein [Methanoplanus sp. FWC-SCC4]WOF15676.1 DUF4013 domain-containing protein [Methanoplanus sp. FWC-SCC4]
MAKDIIGDAFAYTKDSIAGDFMKVILLLVCSFIQGITLNLVPLLNGYVYRIYSGVRPAPEIDRWGELFVQGWKMNIVTLLYMIPAIIIAMVFGIFAIFPAAMGAFSTGDAGSILVFSEFFLGIMLTGVVILLLTLFMTMGLVRLGKTDSIGEAFNISAINDQISKGLGWLGYIGYWILLWIISLIFIAILFVLMVIPLFGWILALILLPIWNIFVARFITNIYEAGD